MERHERHYRTALNMVTNISHSNRNNCLSLRHVCSVKLLLLCVGMRHGILITGSCRARYVLEPGKGEVPGVWSSLHNEELCGYSGKQIEKRSCESDRQLRSGRSVQNTALYPSARPDLRTRIRHCNWDILEGGGREQKGLHDFDGKP